ncbi:uncharacterized protein LOC135477743 [Liolophura sinensis]|uniref:uncharacterized protein LOC135477743 n=1 Tax=Liolophura sinensis TaxID=3198878 RepID=UPI00315904C8
MTVALGINQAELSSISTHEPGPYVGGYLPLRTADDSPTWNRHKAVTEVTVCLMSQLSQDQCLWLAVSSFLDHLLTHHTTLSYMTCWSVIVIINRLYTSGCPIGDSLRNCVIKLSLSLIHSVVAMTVDDSKSEEEVDWLTYRDSVWKAVIGCLAILDPKLVTFLDKFQESVLSPNCPGAHTAVMMLTHIVKTPDLMINLQVDLQKLQTITDTIQKQVCGVIDEQVLTDLLYHVSVITAGGR